ncbi:hypothetical protein SLEP1_g12207 [Rubroshorea leprosula]|uniref:Pentatricopeptide repeat-containing protein n=1 Tax=Rubroshorea leprosula TaxID=152421 RepID=A0AAV5ILJ6_9ROSI|nr:hypothetical protein SLEP1_g12207 [Rubroshorea leprosula]
MPVLNPQIYRSFSSLASAADAQLADKALTILKNHPFRHLDSLSSQFTPEAASCLLLKIQNDKTLTLKFLNWAKRHPFFTPHCQCFTLHILTKFKLYKSAQTLAQDLAVTTSDDAGSFIFQCLKETYHLCGSSSSVFDLVVKSYAHLNLVDKASNIVNLAKFHGFMPGVLSYNAILDALVRCKRPVRLAVEHCKEMIKGGVAPNVFTYNILIRGFCVEGNLEMGLLLFDEMERNGCLPNVVTYNTLIDAYCKSNKINDAYNLLRSMALKGLEPNLISYNVIVNGLCREGRLRETGEVLVEMCRKGFVPDKVTYNTLINGHCRKGNFHQALVLHEEMVKNGLSPNVVTYTSLINSMCKAGNMSRAMEFFNQMHVRKLLPNERTYTTLIDGFSQQGFLNEAFHVLNEMTKNGFLPSVVTYNALINGYCILGRVEEALRLLKEMVEKGLAPDIVSYSTIISGFCKNRDLERAFQMKQEMAEKGISPDTITYSSLINGLSELGRLHEACNLFQEMVDLGLCPDEFSYTSLINGYCREGDISEALDLHNEMVRKGLFPDVVTYSVLINGLNKLARTREAKRLLLKLFYEGSVPNDVTYDTLIENCSNIEFKSVVGLLKGFCMKGLMNEADRVFESMLQKKNKPDESVYNVIIHGHCRGGDVRKAYDLYREMVNSGFIPHTVTVIALVRALFMDGKNDELNQVIKNTLRSSRLTDAELAKVLVEINHKEGNMDVVFYMLTEMAKDGLLPNSGSTAYAGNKV